MRDGNRFEIRSDFDRDRVRNAQHEFEAAESRLDSALQAKKRGRTENRGMRFVDAQRTIERSTKAVFELMNVNYPSEHAIDPRSREARNLLHSVSDAVGDIKYFEQKEDLLDNEELKQLHIGEVARLIFLCDMFGDMYELASYGIDKEDIRLSANDFIQFSDYEYAIEYALASLRISDVIIDSIATGQLPYTDPSTGAGPLEGRSRIKGDYYGVMLPKVDFDPVKEYRREL
jgi:hypothetical protein